MWKPFNAEWEDYKIISCYLVKSHCVIFINEILLSHGGGLITKFKRGGGKLKYISEIAINYNHENLLPIQW